MKKKVPRSFLLVSFIELQIRISVATTKIHFVERPKYDIKIEEWSLSKTNFNRIQNGIATRIRAFKIRFTFYNCTNFLEIIHKIIQKYF